jgi:hypothetical protein
MTERIIVRTDHATQYPWPADMFLQGGTRGVVFRGDGEPYRTAFVEAFPPGTFLRGEGRTVAEAEDACWAQYQRIAQCPAHPEHGPFEARGYTNGAGFCTQCGSWFSKVLPEQPEPAGRKPSFMDRVFSGDTDAALEVLDTMARVDQLPEATS